jgi:phosphoglycolate phosphatase-like HAD superfamily hydrolase
MLIFWDIDGTLIHCGADGTKALNAAFFELYGLEDAFSGAGIGGAMDAVILDGILRNFGLADADPEAIRRVYAAKLMRILEEDEDKTALPGAEALLSYVRGRKGWRNLLLTSNFRIGAEIKLRSLDLWKYFTGEIKGGFGDTRGEKWDAAAEALRALEAREGRAFPPEELFIIGDGVYDLRCARRLGCGHIAVATGWTPKSLLEAEGSGQVFDDLSDTERIAELLERAARGGVLCGKS